MNFRIARPDPRVPPLDGWADDHALADVVGPGERGPAAADGLDRRQRERAAAQHRGGRHAEDDGPIVLKTLLEPRPPDAPAQPF
jgi:hypothetical protein